jgi:hypothetical protein
MHNHEIPVPAQELKYDAIYQARHPKQRVSKRTPANINKRRQANKAAAKSRKGNR